MATNAPSTARARRLRERRSRGVAMVAPVEVGAVGWALFEGFDFVRSVHGFQRQFHQGSDQMKIK